MQGGNKNNKRRKKAKSRPTTEAVVISPGVARRRHSSESRLLAGASHLVAKREDAEVFKSTTLTQLIRDELFGDTKANEFIPAAKLRQVYNFVNVLIHLEKVMFFGFWVCLDAFLGLFSFLPIRLVMALGRCVMSVWSRPLRLSRAQIFDSIRGIIFLVTICFLYCMCDTSITYHWIRQQQAIRLYVLFNVLEIFDRLCCSFGQDIFDALYTNITNRKISRSDNIKVALHVLFSQIYVLVHSLVLLYQLIAMNVALNSRNYTLMHLLVSNNVAELKGSVFKRFRPENLFQLISHDIVERFRLGIFLLVVILHNVYDMSWCITATWLTNLIKLVGLIVVTELLIDWTKHCFVTKFNNISHETYPKCLAFLQYDALCNSPYAHRIQYIGKFISQTKRIGFVPLPLACVTVRMLLPMFPSDQGEIVLLVVGLMIGLAIVKIAVRRVLLTYCMARVTRILRKIEEEPDEDLAGAMRYEFTTRAGRIP